MTAEATGALSIPGPAAETAGAGNPPIGPTKLTVLVPTDVRRCSLNRRDGQPCGATPGRDAPICFVHNPAKRELAAEARHLGGLRRRPTQTIKQVYDVGGLATIEEIGRYLEVALSDLLALDNSVARNRALIAGVLAAVQLHEHGELAAEVRVLRAELDRLGAERADEQDGPA
jgi:hypothetical protein